VTVLISESRKPSAGSLTGHCVPRSHRGAHTVRASHRSPFGQWWRSCVAPPAPRPFSPPGKRTFHRLSRRGLFGGWCHRYSPGVLSSEASQGSEVERCVARPKGGPRCRTGSKATRERSEAFGAAVSRRCRERGYVAQRPRPRRGLPSHYDDCGHTVVCQHDTPGTWRSPCASRLPNRLRSSRLRRSGAHPSRGFVSRPRVARHARRRAPRWLCGREAAIPLSTRHCRDRFRSVLVESLREVTESVLAVAVVPGLLVAVVGVEFDGRALALGGCQDHSLDAALAGSVFQCREEP